MTGRERLKAILHKQLSDRLSWAALVDDNTLSRLPHSLSGMSALDFCRHVGSDLLLLNGWGTEYTFSSPSLVWSPDVTQRVRNDGPDRIVEWHTPNGMLTAVFRSGHPIHYPVGCIDDLRVFHAMWEGAHYARHDDRAAFESIDAAIGRDGVATRFWGPSTIPRLLEYDMGTENFYYLLHDHPEQMEALFSLMHERELTAFELLADGPCDVVILCENTSTYYISPEVYERYNGPHVRDFVETVHAAGKTAIIHMCGHVRGLLPLIGRTGLDGIHALTPPPTGDTPWELALDVLGEDLVIIGVLDPTVFVSGPVQEIGPALSMLFTPRIRQANCILTPAADGICVPLERFQAVGAWMEEHGAR